MLATILQGDCLDELNRGTFAPVVPSGVCVTFLDPPFNQGKEYAHCDDALPEDEYWEWVSRVCAQALRHTTEGGAIYFMQREKNTERVLRCLRETGWTLQNLIIWAKNTSAVPNSWRFGKQYQIIAFATKGRKPRVFHRLRIDAPLRPQHKHERENGVFVTDVWDDIRELTSGYFAGDEALRLPNGVRFHKQQSPITLLLRILLSSSNPGDCVLDPFAGTGPTLVVAEQLGRPSLGIELDPGNVEMIRWRLQTKRKADAILPLRHYYRFTPNLEGVWPADSSAWEEREPQMVLFEKQEGQGHGGT